MSLAAAWRGVRKSSSWTSRALAWSAVAVALACAFVVLSLRYWVLPNIESYREDIAAAVSRAAKVRITIGKISADWEGIRPHLVLEDIHVFDRAGRPALGLQRVESTVAWRSFAALNLHFHSLDIYQPALDVRRDAKGVVSIAGIELQTEDR
ncbi:MAG TPA: TIGR02099 family protein, partial [Burkholderiales bacterium]|nr:TIGR02099 family protein [Burkholderiales bacterium]